MVTPAGRPARTAVKSTRYSDSLGLDLDGGEGVLYFCQRDFPHEPFVLGSVRGGFLFYYQILRLAASRQLLHEASALLAFHGTM